MEFDPNVEGQGGMLLVLICHFPIADQDVPMRLPIDVTEELKKSHKASIQKADEAVNLLRPIRSTLEDLDACREDFGDPIQSAEGALNSARKGLGQLREMKGYLGDEIVNEEIYRLQRQAKIRIEDSSIDLNAAHKRLAEKKDQLEDPLRSIVQEVCSERIAKARQSLNHAVEHASQVTAELYEQLETEHKRLQKRVADYVSNEMARRPTRNVGGDAWRDLYDHAEEAYGLDLRSYLSNHKDQIEPLFGGRVNIIDAAPHMQRETDTDALVILLKSAKNIFEEHPD